MVTRWPRRTLAAVALPIAFAAVAVTFGSEFLYGVAIAPPVAFAASAGVTVAGALLLAVLAERASVGPRLGQTSLGPLLVRPPSTALALVGLSLCGLVAWLVVSPETTSPAEAAGTMVVTLILYAPAWLLYVCTFALSVVVPDPTTLSSAGVRTVVFAGGAALSALWQLLLASVLVRSVTDDWLSEPDDARDAGG